MTVENTGVSSHPKANEATAKLIQFYEKAKELMSRGSWNPIALSDDDFLKLPGTKSWIVERLEKDISDAGIGKTAKDALQKFIETAIGKKYYELGMKAVTNEINYGAATWYEWCCREWGTKWNSYDCSVDRDSGYISFSTAWCCPDPIVSKLAEMYPNVHFKWEYADEDTGSNTGLYINDDPLGI